MQVTNNGRTTYVAYCVFQDGYSLRDTIRSSMHTCAQDFTERKGVDHFSDLREAEADYRIHEISFQKGACDA